MASNTTTRFKYPIPTWDADWQKWQQTFGVLADGMDATMFALMEHLTLIPHTLPTVEVVDTAGVYTFTQLGDAVFVSRTMQVQITVAATVVTLIPGALIGVALQPGATGPQSVVWQQWVSQVDVDPTLVVLGIVNSDYTITWYNGARLSVEVPTTLFAFIEGTAAAFMSGVGNPNGVVSAVAGMTYYDTSLHVLYVNVNGGTIWMLM